MKTCGTSLEISQRFLCSFWIIENFHIEMSWLRRRLRNNSLKNGTDRPHPPLECRCEIVTARKAKAARETAQWFRLVWNGVGLLFRFDLQRVFDSAEKSIRAVQSQNFFAREQIQLSKCVECLEHTRFLEERMARAMDKLQCLHDEFDLANAAAPKFYVAI